MIKTQRLIRSSQYLRRVEEEEWEEKDKMKTIIDLSPIREVFFFQTKDLANHVNTFYRFIGEKKYNKTKKNERNSYSHLTKHIPKKITIYK